MATAITASYHNIHSKPHVSGPKCQVTLTAQDLARFWAKIEQGAPEACWLWSASVTGTGSVKHGQFTVTRHRKQISLKPHRMVWELAHGVIPDGLCVCHRCDVGHCCNPAHLFLGTQQDNLNDARRKGRLVDGLGARKLSADAYRAILLTTARGVDLARKYGVSEVTICRIRAGVQGKRLAERVLQDEAGESQPCLSPTDLVHQILQPVPSRQLPIRGEVG